METTIYYGNSGAFTADVLLPCPFCGAKPNITFVGNDYTKKRKVNVKCPKCRAERTDAGIRTNLNDLAVVAIKNWNERGTKNKRSQDQALNLHGVSDLLIAWEEYKKANWYESEAIDVEKMLMEQFSKAIYGR